MERRRYLALTAAALAGCSTRAESQYTPTEPAISNDSLDVMLSLGKRMHSVHDGEVPEWIIEDLRDLFSFVDLTIDVDGPVLYSEHFGTASEAVDWWYDRADWSYDSDVLLVRPHMDWGDVGRAEIGEPVAVCRLREIMCTPRSIAHEIGHNLGIRHEGHEGTIMTGEGVCGAPPEWSEDSKQKIEGSL